MFLLMTIDQCVFYYTKVETINKIILFFIEVAKCSIV